MQATVATNNERLIKVAKEKAVFNTFLMGL